jgi:hypothetical protein
VQVAGLVEDEDTAAGVEVTRESSTAGGVSPLASSAAPVSSAAAS